MFTNRKSLITLSVAMIFCLIPVSPSGASFFGGPKPGDLCKTKDEVVKIAGKSYRCAVMASKKSVWTINPPITRTTQAHSLATYACSFGSYERVPNLYPRLWLGAILSHGINTGQLEYPKKKLDRVSWSADIAQSDRISLMLITAETLDSRWSKLNGLWEKGVATTSAAFDSGKDVISSLDTASDVTEPMNNICNIVIKEMKNFAKLERRTDDEWLKRNSKGLLPPYPTSL